MDCEMPRNRTPMALNCCAPTVHSGLARVRTLVHTMQVKAINSIMFTRSINLSWLQLAMPQTPPAAWPQSWPPSLYRAWGFEALATQTKRNYYYSSKYLRHFLKPFFRRPPRHQKAKLFENDEAPVLRKPVSWATSPNQAPALSVSTVITWQTSIDPLRLPGPKMTSIYK